MELAEYVHNGQDMIKRHVNASQFVNLLINSITLANADVSLDSKGTIKTVFLRNAQTTVSLTKSQILVSVCSDFTYPNRLANARRFCNVQQIANL
jgi:hypothetical protein